jgi:hypothetical protein
MGDQNSPEDTWRVLSAEFWTALVEVNLHVYKDMALSGFM